MIVHARGDLTELLIAESPQDALRLEFLGGSEYVLKLGNVPLFDFYLRQWICDGKEKYDAFPLGTPVSLQQALVADEADFVLAYSLQTERVPDFAAILPVGRYVVLPELRRVPLPLPREHLSWAMPDVLVARRGSPLRSAHAVYLAIPMTGHSLAGDSCQTGPLQGVLFEIWPWAEQDIVVIPLEGELITDLYPKDCGPLPERLSWRGIALSMVAFLRNPRVETFTFTSTEKVRRAVLFEADSGMIVVAYHPEPSIQRHCEGSRFAIQGNHLELTLHLTPPQAPKSRPVFGKAGRIEAAFCGKLTHWQRPQDI